MDKRFLLYNLIAQLECLFFSKNWASKWLKAEFENLHSYKKELHPEKVRAYVSLRGCHSRTWKNNIHLHSFYECFSFNEEFGNNLQAKKRKREKTNFYSNYETLGPFLIIHQSSHHQYIEIQQTAFDEERKLRRRKIVIHSHSKLLRILPSSKK